MAEELYVYEGSIDGANDITGIAISWATSVDEICAFAWGAVSGDNAWQAGRRALLTNAGNITYDANAGTFSCMCPFDSDIKGWKLFIWKKNTGLDVHDLFDEWDGNTIPVDSIVDDIETVKTRLREHWVNLNRALRAPEEGGDNLIIPPVAARANRILGFDSDGLPTVGDDCDAIADFTNAANAVKELVSDAESAASEAKASATAAETAKTATEDAAKSAVETITNLTTDGVEKMEALVEQSTENAATAESAAVSAAESAEEAKRAVVGDIDLSGYVDVKTDQTVNGVKSFTGLAAFAQDENDETSYARWTIKPEIEDGALRFTSEGGNENHFYLKPSSDMEDGDEATIALDRDVTNAVSVAKTEIAADIEATKSELEAEIQKVAESTPEIDTSSLVHITGKETITGTKTFVVTQHFSATEHDSWSLFSKSQEWDGVLDTYEGDIWFSDTENAPNSHITIGKYFVDGAPNALIVSTLNSTTTQNVIVRIPLTKSGTVALLDDLPTGTTEGGDSSTYVTLTGEQTIYGNKTFSAGTLKVIANNTTYDVGEQIARVAAEDFSEYVKFLPGMDNAGSERSGEKYIYFFDENYNQPAIGSDGSGVNIITTSGGSLNIYDRQRWTKYCTYASDSCSINTFAQDSSSTSQINICAYGQKTGYGVPASITLTSGLLGGRSAAEIVASDFSVVGPGGATGIAVSGYNVSLPSATFCAYDYATGTTYSGSSSTVMIAYDQTKHDTTDQYTQLLQAKDGTIALLDDILDGLGQSLQEEMTEVQEEIAKIKEDVATLSPESVLALAQEIESLKTRVTALENYVYSN